MNARAILLTLTAAAVLAAASPAGEGQHEWPMKSGDPGWTGFSPDERVKPPFRLKWATAVSGQVACLSVADGRVYGRDVCLDAETGRVLWKSRISSNTPTYEGVRLYGGGGRISAFDATTGKRLWSKSGYLCSRTYKTAVTACDGAVFGGRIKDHEGKKFYFAEALDAATGKELWSTPLVPAEGKPPQGNVLGVAMSNAGVAGGRVFVSTHEPKMVFALDQKTGREIWRHAGDCARHALSTDGKTVWAAECAQGVAALDAATGKKLWHWGGYEMSSAEAHYKRTGTADHPPTAAYGKLFMACYGRNYSVLDAATGKELRVLGNQPREVNMWGGGCGPLTAAGGFIYSNCLVGKEYNGASTRRDLYAVDPESGKPVWRWALSGKSCGRVALAHGRLYAVTRSEIYCFEPVKKGEKVLQPQPAPAQPAAA
ncbi:MAG: PQQ-binding-like beta-propeller repeat protein, partial [Planctomycetota bacterium]